MKDIYVVPDYAGWMERSLDSKLNLLHKKIDTKHQWRFEAVNPSFFFPFGVKTAYRAYSSDKVVEFSEPQALEVCLHPVGQHTGLDPKTLYCTWEPEAYGANSLRDRQGIEGFYLLRNIPSGPISPLPFMPNSIFYTYSFMKRIYKKYPLDSYKEIHGKWKQWYENIAPKAIVDNQNLVNGRVQVLEESSESYIERMKITGRARHVAFPLSSFFLKAEDSNKDVRWNIEHNDQDVFDPKFVWPESLVAAMKSVESSIDTEPHAPRLHAQNDQRLIFTRQSFFTGVERFFETIKALQLQAINRYIRRLLYTSGSDQGSGTTKAQMLKILRQWCSNFYTIVFRPVNEIYSSLVNQYLTIPASNITEANRILITIKTSRRNKVKVHRRDVKEWGDDLYTVPDTVFEALISLLALRDDIVCKCYIHHKFYLIRIFIIFHYFLAIKHAFFR